MELPFGIRRITTPLPTRPGHVHSYLLPGEDGWTLVDTGIGLPDAQERLGAASLDGAEVARIFVTHFHPDHVGAAADVAELTGRRCYQGALDYAQCELVWGNPNWPERIAEWFRPHGVPRRDHRGADRVRRRLPAVHPLPARPGARRRRATASTAGSSSPRRATPTASSACSKTACSSRPTTCSAGSRPLSGSGPASRPDPLGDYLDVARAHDRARARARAARPRRPDRGPGRPGARADRAPPRAARASPRRRSSDAPRTRLRGLVRPLRRRAEAGRAPLRRRRDALPPRAARARGAGRARHDDGGTVTYTARQLGRRAPPSTRAPESGA